jgi:hypothetical protein
MDVGYLHLETDRLCAALVDLNDGIVYAGSEIRGKLGESACTGRVPLQTLGRSN